jgi:hypothetical protein
VINLRDAPELLLTIAVRRMPAERSEWGAAMLAELAQLQHPFTRWRFALGCARVALFSPRKSGLLQYLMNLMNRVNKPVCGILSVALTPLAILFAYFASAIFADKPPHAVGRAIVLLSEFFILVGMVMGVVALVRRERYRWLAAIGWITTICIVGLMIYLDTDG